MSISDRRAPEDYLLRADDPLIGSGTRRPRRGWRTRDPERVGIARVTAGAITALLGLVCLGLGAMVQLTPESRDPVPLEVGKVYTVPDRVPFASPLVVYGTSRGEARPRLSELGCEVTEGGGPLSTSRAASEDRIVIDGQGVRPLVLFPGKAGHSIVCAGDGSVSNAPLYVAPAGDDRALITVAAYCTAALLVPIGLLGVSRIRTVQP